jgi:hypothetical protein
MPDDARATVRLFPDRTQAGTNSVAKDEKGQVGSARDPLLVLSSDLGNLTTGDANVR